MQHGASLINRSLKQKYGSQERAVALALARSWGDKTTGILIKNLLAKELRSYLTLTSGELNDAIIAIGDLNVQAAIPLLIKIIKENSDLTSKKRISYKAIERTITALGKLKAKDAVFPIINIMHEAEFRHSQSRYINEDLVAIIDYADAALASIAEMEESKSAADWHRFFKKKRSGNL